MPSSLYEVGRAFSMVVFFLYGAYCLRSPRSILDFERYGLPRLRRLTGWLEIAGALGLLVGYAWTPLVAAAAGGLSLLMLMGFLARMRIRDSLLDSMPALTLCALNAYLCVEAIKRISGQ